MIFLLLTLSLSGAGVVQSGPPALRVTEVRRGDGGFPLVLNGGLVVHEVRRGLPGAGSRFILPEIIGGDGTVYRDIEVVSPSAYYTMERAVLSGRGTESAEPLRFRVGPVRTLSHKKRKANVDVVFNEALRITLGILKEGTGKKSTVRAVFPAKKIGNEYKDLVDIPDPVLRKKVLAAAERLYGESREKSW